MQEEITRFAGEIYKAVDDAIGYVNDHERPLGLYYFGEDLPRKPGLKFHNFRCVGERCSHTYHAGRAPFGGVGPSMGSITGTKAS